MDRREFLRRSGVAALGASLLPIVSSCTLESGTAPPTSTPTTPAEWRTLADSLDGTLYRPTSSGYGAASMLFDPRFDGAHGRSRAPRRPGRAAADLSVQPRRVGP